MLLQANEDHNLYTFDMRKLQRALMVHKDHVSAVCVVVRSFSRTGGDPGLLTECDCLQDGRGVLADRPGDRVGLVRPHDPHLQHSRGQEPRGVSRQAHAAVRHRRRCRVCYPSFAPTRHDAIFGSGGSR